MLLGFGLWQYLHLLLNTVRLAFEQGNICTVQQPICIGALLQANSAESSGQRTPREGIDSDSDTESDSPAPAPAVGQKRARWTSAFDAAISAARSASAGGVLAAAASVAARLTQQRPGAAKVARTDDNSGAGTSKSHGHKPSALDQAAAEPTIGTRTRSGLLAGPDPAAAKSSRLAAQNAAPTADAPSFKAQRPTAIPHEVLAAATQRKLSLPEHANNGGPRSPTAAKGHNAK